jgi:NDP-sugar pyrophosphorylase family protein
MGSDEAGAAGHNCALHAQVRRRSDESVTNMNAMVLAAGLGTRLGDLGTRIPKALIPVGGRPLLARHLELLGQAGAERVVVNAHHLASEIETFVRAYDGPLELVCMVEPRLLGTAGSVRRALPNLEPGPFLVVYGDVVISDSLAPLVATHADARPAATLAVHEETSAEGKGVIEVDAEGRVTAFSEKGVQGRGPFLVNSGVYVVESELVRDLPEDVPHDFGHDVFPRALAAGETLLAHRLRRQVVDIGTEEGLARARTLAR